MLGVRSAAGCCRFRAYRSPAALFSRAPGQNNKRILGGLASRRSRKLGTAFRSPVTTLTPPLRGHCSRTCSFASTQETWRRPVRSRALRSVRFRSRNRANSSPSTRCQCCFQRSRKDPPSPLPLGHLQPAGSTRSTGFVTGSSLRRTLDLPFAPRRVCLSTSAADRRSKLRLVQLGNHSVNPGTASIMLRSPRFGQREKGFFQTLSSGFLANVVNDIR